MGRNLCSGWGGVGDWERMIGMRRSGHNTDAGAEAPRRGASRSRRGRGAVVLRALWHWEDPLTWAFGLIGVRGVTFAVHGVMVLWAAILLTLSFTRDFPLGPPFVGLGILALLLVVLVREGVRRWMCGVLGGEWPVVVLWQLGSLGGPSGFPGRVARTLVVLSGLGAHLALWPVLALLCLAVGIPAEMLVFDPRDPRAAMMALPGPMVYIQALVWWAYAINIIVFGVNMLVPMLPLDLGRLVEISLAGREGGAATRGAAVMGLGAATLLITAGALLGMSALVVLGAVGGVYCWLQVGKSDLVERYMPGVVVDPDDEEERARGILDGGLSPGGEETRHGKVMGGADDGASADAGNGGLGAVSGTPRGPTRHEAHAPVGRGDESEDDGAEGEQEPAGGNDLDRILGKISASGLASLTAEEREFLEAETRRRRGEGPKGAPENELGE